MQCSTVKWTLGAVKRTEIYVPGVIQTKQNKNHWCNFPLLSPSWGVSVYIPQPQTALGDHLLSSVYLTPGEQTKQDVDRFVWNSLFGFETLRRGDAEKKDWRSDDWKRIGIFTITVWLLIESIAEVKHAY